MSSDCIRPDEEGERIKRGLEILNRALENQMFLHIHGFISDAEQVKVKRRIDKEAQKIGFTRIGWER
jgi:hypothetical protein